MAAEAVSPAPVRLSYRVAVPLASALAIFALPVAVAFVATFATLALAGQPTRMPLATLGAFAMLMALLALAYWVLGGGSVSVDPARVLASAAPYRFEALRDDIVPNGVRSLATLDGVRFHMRRNGIGLPGYRVGWYSLSVHGEPHQAFVIVTTPPCLLIALKSGERMLLSCPLRQVPQALTLLSLGPGSPRA